MLFPSSLPEQRCDSALRGVRCARSRPRQTRKALGRFSVEPLEERCLLASYSVIDLGTLGGTYSRADGINAFGQVVGQSSIAAQTHAFVWTPTTQNGMSGSMIDLGTLGGTYSVAYGINAFGQVVGNALTAAGVSHAYLWTPTTANGTSGSMIDLGTLGGTVSIALAINNATASHSVQVVGVASLPGDTASLAFLWEDLNQNGQSDPGEMKDLGTLGGVNSSAGLNGINDASQVSGYANLAGGQERAFLWQNGVMTNLGTLTGTNGGSIGTGLNGLAQVVGSSGTARSNVSDAFLWQNGVITDLGALKNSGTVGGSEAVALAINGSGQVVGRATPVGGNFPDDNHAFLWKSKTGMTDLNKLIATGSGWTLNSAAGITDDGRVVGYGTINTQTHAYLLKPLSGTTRTMSATNVVRPSSPTVTHPHTGAVTSIVIIPSQQDAGPHAARMEAADHAIASLIGTEPRRRSGRLRRVDLDVVFLAEIARLV